MDEELQEDHHKVRETGNDISRFNQVSFNHDTVESIEIGSMKKLLLVRNGKYIPNKAVAHAVRKYGKKG